MKNAEAFILSSLWEDPGFVLIEAAMNNLFIISSNCKNGPTEFLNDGKGGFYLKVTIKMLSMMSLKFLKIRSSQIYLSKIKVAKKNCKKYSLLNHYVVLTSKILRSQKRY